MGLEGVGGTVHPSLPKYMQRLGLKGNQRCYFSMGSSRSWGRGEHEAIRRVSVGQGGSSSRTQACDERPRVLLLQPVCDMQPYSASLFQSRDSLRLGSHAAEPMEQSEGKLRAQPVPHPMLMSKSMGVAGQCGSVG